MSVIHTHFWCECLPNAHSNFTETSYVPKIKKRQAMFDTKLGYVFMIWPLLDENSGIHMTKLRNLPCCTTAVFRIIQ